MEKNEKQKRKLGKKGIIAIIATVIIAISVIAGVTIHHFAIQPKNEYNKAVALYEEGKYDKALAIFQELGDYKDSMDYVVKSINGIENAEKANQGTEDSNEEVIIEESTEENPTEESTTENYIQIEETEAPKTARDNNKEIGDEFIMGSYAGDEIKWIVLDVEGNKSFVISKYILNAFPYENDVDQYVEGDGYHDYARGLCWETCSLRKWLNNDFYNNCFSNSEKSKIITTNVNNGKTYHSQVENYDWSIVLYEGDNTNDKIFLLSIDEAYEYFDNYTSRTAYATQYALENDINVYLTGYSWWWLRNNTPYGILGLEREACAVTATGKLDSVAADSSTSAGVRPAMWIYNN